MAKLRKNHSQETNKRGSTETSFKKQSLKYLVWFLMIVALMFILNNVDSPSWEAPSNSPTTSGAVTLSDHTGESLNKSFYPESSTGQVIKHKHYTLSYDEEHEQAEWVAYKLTEESLRIPNVKRAKRFNADKAVKTRSANHGDYTHSGYTRGHLAPAGDMAFSIEAMQESFFMSNMSPQKKEFNGGIWRELEETVRDWAFDHDELYIVSGPVLKKGHIVTQIGHNKVSVPDSFYKIVLDIKGNDKKAIAFLMPNELSTKPIKEYVTSIDDIEKLVGLDFFAGFLNHDLENRIESSTSLKGWKFDTKRFETRIRNWNKR